MPEQEKARFFYWAVASWVVLLSIVFGALSFATWDAHQESQNAVADAQAAIAAAERNRMAGVDATLDNCQRANELRRGIKALAEELNDRTRRVRGSSDPADRELGLQFIELDKDVGAISSCRRAVRDAHGVDVGDVSNFIGNR